MIGNLKNAVVDVAITIVIGIAVFAGPEWARWVVWIYTPLMLVLKALALAVPVGLAGRTSKKAHAPDALIHILYAANIVMLGVGRWWLEAAGWSAIWLLSIVAMRRLSPRRSSAE